MSDFRVYFKPQISYSSLEKSYCNKVRDTDNIGLRLVFRTKTALAFVVKYFCK